MQMHRTLRTVIVTALVSAGIGATAQAADAASYLQSPTGNIVCRAASTGDGPNLSCDVKSAGVSYNLNRYGRAWIGGYHGYDYGQVARYGHAYRSRGFRCRTDQSGMTCISLASGHGFFLSREERSRW